jgi:hypothetical protein
VYSGVAFPCFVLSFSVVSLLVSLLYVRVSLGGAVVTVRVTHRFPSSAILRGVCVIVCLHLGDNSSKAFIQYGVLHNTQAKCTQVSQGHHRNERKNVGYDKDDDFDGPSLTKLLSVTSSH